MDDSGGEATHTGFRNVRTDYVFAGGGSRTGNAECAVPVRKSKYLS